MKLKLLSSLVVLAFASPVLASQNGQAQGEQRQQQQTTVTSGSESQASNNGNTQSIIFSSPGESRSTVRYEGGTRQEVINSGTSRVKNVPSVSGPPLVSSNDTCMGSVSGSVNVAGFGGGFGTTYKDANCVMLKNSRELWNMGMRGAALARMCMDADNREALEITGFVCPQTERAQKQQAAESVEERPDVTDPLARSRMGLRPLREVK